MILNDQTTRGNLRSIREEKDGPKRLARLLRFVEQDIAHIPIVDAPEAVTSAHNALLGALDLGRELIDRHGEASRAIGQAADKDVREIAAALREAKALPKSLGAITARGKAELAGVTVEAGERVLEELHDEFIEAVKAAWPDWRREIVQSAEAKRISAQEAVARAAEAVKEATTRYEAVGALDATVVGRYPSVAEQVRNEERDGLKWYEVTRLGDKPLRTISVAQGRGRVPVDPEKALEALMDALGHTAFPLAEWCPPGDERHEEMQRTPLDPESPWLLKAVRNVHGAACAICGSVQCDSLAHIDGVLWPVHERCTKNPPDEKERRRAAYLAKLEREGFPEERRHIFVG